MPSYRLPQASSLNSSILPSRLIIISLKQYASEVLKPAAMCLNPKEAFITGSEPLEIHAAGFRTSDAYCFREIIMSLEGRIELLRDEA